MHLVGRSFKYHRPRGFLSAGAEEPNALVTVTRGPGRLTPNLRATQIELHDGLVATSQNRWPSLTFDIGAVNDLLSPLFGAGFYYKTFMGPDLLGKNWAWTRVYEPMIRRAAGLGQAPREPDPDRYARTFDHCDVLIAGGGPAGLAAALAASQSGARVVVCDENPALGGSLLAEDEAEIDGENAPQWLDSALAALRSAPNVRLMTRTQAFGYYAQNFVGLNERLAEADLIADPDLPRERLWQMRAREVVLATGPRSSVRSFFRIMIGRAVMLADAARRYARQYGAKVGCPRRRRDDARQPLFRGARSQESRRRRSSRLSISARKPKDRWRIPSGPRASKSIPGAAILGVDRPPPGQGRPDQASRWRSHSSLRRAAHVGRMDAFGASLLPIARQAPPSTKRCNSSSPAPRLNANDRPALATRPSILLARSQKATRPGVRRRRRRVLLRRPCAPTLSRAWFQRLAPRPRISLQVTRTRRAKAFVDFQNDVCAKDVSLAVQEGMRSIEHIKRYTTTGMATDQGKLSNMNALGIAAAELEKTIPEVGLTTFRPPYTPVTFGAFAGPARGDLFDPIRRTPIHEWAAENGAAFEDVSLWKRAWYFPRPGESMHDAVTRECRTTRASVGLFDATTLGKIEVVGPDAASVSRTHVRQRFPEARGWSVPLWPHAERSRFPHGRWRDRAPETRPLFT